MTHTLALWAYITIYLIALWGIWRHHKNQETIKVGTGSITFPLIVILLLTYGANWWQFSATSPSGIDIHIDPGPRMAAILILIALPLWSLIAGIVRKQEEKLVTARKAAMVTALSAVSVALAVYGAGWV